MDETNRLKVVLAEKHKTNKWLAEKLNFKETTVSRWVQNKQQPSVKTLKAIANFLEVDIRYLFNPTRPDNLP